MDASRRWYDKYFVTRVGKLYLLLLMTLQEGEYTLVANVPAIRGVTDPWKVYLVDNPGCGDAHEGVNDLAHGALKSSQAYVYLVHYRQLGDQDDYMSFKTMHERDPGKLTYIHVCQ